MESGYLLFVVFFIGITNTYTEHSAETGATQRSYGSPFDEVVVESSLNVRKKAQNNRQTRSYISANILPAFRQKRQFKPFTNGGEYGGSSSSANAAAQNNYFGMNGFGGSAAQAQAQGFQAHGPLGGFGSSASNAQSQSFNAGPQGLQGSAGLSGGQSYNLPNGQTLSLTYSNGFSVGPDGRPVVSKGNSIAFS